MDIKIRKKSGRLEPYTPQKIVNAIYKSADRIGYKFQDWEIENILQSIEEGIIHDGKEVVPVPKMHHYVELALDKWTPDVAASYRSYRDYKVESNARMRKMFEDSQSILYLGDKSNANTNSTLAATQLTLTRRTFEKYIFQDYYMSPELKEAHDTGYIYVHDLTERRIMPFNCCLFRMGEVLKGGFEMANQWYNEPKRLCSAAGVIGDVTLSSASQQYGGFTISQIDTVLEPYAEKTYNAYVDEALEGAKKALELTGTNWEDLSDEAKEKLQKNAEDVAWKKTAKDMESVFQEFEYKFNTVGSSRGDYPFITMTAGLGTSRFAKLAAITMFNVRKNGQGAEGKKKPVLFPKLVMLYTADLHGEGKPNRDVYEAALDCTSKCMYPDWLSLDGNNNVGNHYHQYGEVISPMGCRAFLSPWWERGGMEPADENDRPVYNGRFNMGVVSLHLPMILAKARRDGTEFFDELTYYLEMIRAFHRKTILLLGEKKASINPLAFCEGGLYGGNLKPEDKIAPVLKAATISFGITALNELQQLYNGKSLVEDGEFALETMKFINGKLAEFKKADGILYAIYGTPAESLCGRQIEQFRREFGIIPNVSDREYVSNSFHCHVTENITPIQKQDLENRFWDEFGGGRIQYVRYNLGYNVKAMESLIMRAMGMGFYEGANMALSYCDDCGHEEIDMGNTCPKCGSENITKIDRMNGYLGFTRIKGDTRMNKAKMAEVKDRVSM